MISRASSASSATRRRSAPRSSRRSPRRKAPTRCGCSRSTPRRGSSSRSSSSRTRVATSAGGRRPTRSSRSPTDASASRSSIPTSGEPKAVFGYDEVAGAGREAARAERLRLYYVAMTRAIDRLIVSGALGESRDTPIGWVLVEARLRGGARAGEADLFELERGGASFLVRRRPARPSSRRARAGADEPGGRAQLSLFAELPRRPAGARLAPARARARCRRRRCTACVSSRTRRSRSSSAARTATTPSGSPGSASGARRRGRRRAAWRDRDRRRRAPPARAGRPAPTRVCPTSRSCGRGTRGVTDEELERIEALRRGSYCESPLARRVASLAGVRPERAVRVPARRRPAPRPARRPAPRRAARARRRLQDERARRAHAGGGRRVRLPSSAARLRPRVLPRRRRRGGGRVHVPRASRRGRLQRPSPVPRFRSSRPSCRRRSHGSTRASSSRRPGEFTCSGCPALDLVCAGPRGWSRRPSGRRARRRAGGSGSRCRLTVARSYVHEARKRVGPKRARIRPVIERLAVEHADAGIALTLPGTRSSCSSR